MAGPWEKYAPADAEPKPWERYGTPAAPDTAPEQAAEPKFDVGTGVIVPSAVKFAKDVAQPFIHPVETGEALYNLGLGILEKTGLKESTGKEVYPEAVGKFFVDRYGSLDAAKRTLETDPVGMAADVSMLLTGGGSALARAPGVAGKVGEVVRTAGRVVDPLTPVVKGAQLAGRGAAEVIGGLGTHTGGEALRTAARAGEQGGPAGEAFLANLRGAEPLEETVKAARQAVQQMRQERGNAYRSGMIPVAQDATILSFNDLARAVTDAQKIKTYAGRSGRGPVQSLSPKTEAIRNEMIDEIRTWYNLPASEFHTAEGFDKLKQKLGDIRDATEYGSPARRAADEIYHAARDTIVKQVPEYAKVMKGYEDASKQIKELEKTLSLNPNASVDTALRKLQSVLRDNVNTSFGHRKELAQFLVDAGAPNLMERLAGQALKPWAPRGLAKLIGSQIVAMMAAAAGAGTAGATGAATGLGAVLPFLSPRLMGEGAYRVGQAQRLPGRAMGSAAFQTGRLGAQLNPRTMVQEDAKDALRSAPEKRFTSRQIATLREVASGKASVDSVMYVKKLLERPTYQGPQ